jgi:hypothetical protein
MRVTARPGVAWFAGIVRSRRRGRRSRRRRYGSSLLDSFCRQSKSTTAITMVSSAWLGGAPIAGGNGDRRSQGFGYGEFLGEEEEDELDFVLGLLYDAGARLVTKSSSGRSPARRKRGARRRAVQHACWRG